jgi:hypothetical protein
MGTSTRDLHVFESGNGGELALLSGDLVLVESLYQTIYIALFGGNVEASTLGNEIDSEERNDYWANALIFKNKPSKQFNSNTERTLSNVTINTSGRLKIQSAVEQDLFFLKKIVDFEVNIVILDINKIQIDLKLEEIPNQSDKQFQFIWDNAEKQIISDNII